MAEQAGPAAGTARSAGGARQVVSGLLALAAVAAVVVVSARWTGLDRFPVVAQLAAFRPQGTALLAVLALAVLRWHRRGAAALAAVALASGVGVVPRALADPEPAPGAELRVLLLNVTYDRVEPAALAGLVESARPDVVALPEASAAYADEVLALVGGSYAAATDAPGGPAPRRADATSLLVRDGLAPSFVPGALPLGLGTVSATLAGATVHAVHPYPPLPGAEGRWRADLAGLRDACAATTPTVVVGDLNATLDASGLRALLDAGCTDVADATGRALVGTWPADRPRWLGVGIDRVLVAGGVRPRSLEVLDVPGGDHRAVLATVVLPS